MNGTCFIARPAHAAADNIVTDSRGVCDAQTRKCLAVLMYQIGARSLEDTQAAFDQHPEWAST